MLLSHKPLADSEVQQVIINLFNEIQLQNITLESWDNQQYFDAFQKWINDSRYNRFIGLDLFKHHAYSCGAVDSIQSFIHRHSVSKRIRFSDAEFIGAKIAANHSSAKWEFLEDAAIEAGDAVLLSLPFAGNGNMYRALDQLLDVCDALSVPVLIDCSYFGISYNATVDLSRNCITDVVFSLSKPFSTPLRLGYRLTKQYVDDILQANSDLKIYNRYSVQVGIKLLSQFSHNWIVEKYRPVQEKVCKELGLTPAMTLTLADDCQQRDKFFRNGYYRVCITDELQQ